MQTVHIPASPQAWHESGQSISIDGQYNTGVCFPPGQSTKVEHTPTASVNLYGHLKTKSKKSHASADVDNEIQSTNKLCNAQCVEQPETILEHRMRQPLQLGCKTYDLSPEDPSSLQSCQLGNHTDALDATNNTPTPGAVGAWPRIRESKQEHPVIEQDKSSKDEQKMTPDKNEPYCWTHNADDYSPGPIYDHQAISQEGSKANPNLAATIANFPPTKDISNLRDLIGLINYFSHHNPELQHPMAIWQLLMKKSNKFAWPTSRKDGTRCYPLARPPEDDANGHAPNI